MSSVATIATVGTIGSSVYSSSQSNKAASVAAGGSSRAAMMQYLSQRSALKKLREREALPQALREGALTELGGLAGLGDPDSQQKQIDLAKSSPLYQEIMGSREAGEDSIMRHAGMTGGLRSGDTSSNLSDYNMQLENRALLEAYNQQVSGLQGLAGLPSNANNMANIQMGMGTTASQGIIAGTQARVDGIQGQTEAVLGGVEGLTSFAGAGGYADLVGMFSDRRLKTNIKKIGEILGHNFYSFTWNKLAESIGLTGETKGVMANEVYRTRPDAVSLRHGFLFVNYKTLGILPGE